MDYKEAINAIKSNWPDERYTELRDALTFAIRTMNNHYSPLETKMHCVILNGVPSQETYEHYQEKGWRIMYLAQAKLFHPYAAETDTILFMAKPIDKEDYDKYMNDAKKEHLPDSAE
jgi:hypothetical protein